VISASRTNNVPILLRRCIHHAWHASLQITTNIPLHDRFQELQDIFHIARWLILLAGHLEIISM
jgi:hypothetical protein